MAADTWLLGATVLPSAPVPTRCHILRPPCERRDAAPPSATSRIHASPGPPLPSTATVELVIARDPLLLLERAAEAFLCPLGAGANGAFPSPPYLLALRQGGLRDDLIRLATAHGLPGWLDPPLCTFQELPARLGATDRVPCDDFERAVILGGVLRQFGGDVFGRLQRPQDFIGALDRLFGELVAEDTLPAEFRAALESRGDRDGFEKARDGELQVIYAQYLVRLAENNRRDGRDAQLDCARAIAAAPTALAERLGGRSEIRLFGLQDLRGGWRALIGALVGSGVVDRVVIYSAEELELELETRLTRLDESESIACRLFCHPERSEGPTQRVPETSEQDPSVAKPALSAAEGLPQDDSAPSRSEAAPAVHAILAPDVERELDEVARRVRALADTGVPLHRIAVIARQARPYVDLTLAALDRFGVPATARRRIAWSEVPVIRAVRSLLAAAAEGWTRHGLAELAEQPYFANELDVRLVNYAGFRRRLEGLKAWRQALDGIAQEAQAEEERAARGEESDERRAPLPPAARAREAAEGFAAFAGRAAELDPPRHAGPVARLAPRASSTPTRGTWNGASGASPPPATTSPGSTWPAGADSHAGGPLVRRARRVGRRRGPLHAEGVLPRVPRPARRRRRPLDPGPARRAGARRLRRGVPVVRPCVPRRPRGRPVPAPGPDLAHP